MCNIASGLLTHLDSKTEIAGLLRPAMVPLGITGRKLAQSAPAAGTQQDDGYTVC